MHNLSIIDLAWSSSVSYAIVHVGCALYVFRWDDLQNLSAQFVYMCLYPVLA